MAEVERAAVSPLAPQQSLRNRPLSAGQLLYPDVRLYSVGAGEFLLTAAICWGLAPLLVMGLLLASEATRLVRDTLGMAGPGGEL